MQRLKEGHKRAATTLMNAHYGWLKKYALRYSGGGGSRGDHELFEDLFQVGRLGLLEGFARGDVERWETVRGYALSFAVAYMSRYRVDCGETVRRSVHLVTRDRLMFKRFVFGFEDLESVMDTKHSGGSTFRDSVESQVPDTRPLVEEQISDEEVERATPILGRRLLMLVDDARARGMLKEYFYKGRTLQEIGDATPSSFSATGALTRERVRQIIENTLRLLAALTHARAFQGRGYDAWVRHLIDQPIAGGVRLIEQERREETQEEEQQEEAEPSEPEEPEEPEEFEASPVDDSVVRIRVGTESDLIAPPSNSKLSMEPNKSQTILNILEVEGMMTRTKLVERMKELLGPKCAAKEKIVSLIYGLERARRLHRDRESDLLSLTEEGS